MALTTAKLWLIYNCGTPITCRSWRKSFNPTTLIEIVAIAFKFHSGQTQRAFSVWPLLLPVNCRGIKNNCFKKSKDTGLLEREVLNVEYHRQRSPDLFTSDFIVSYFVLSIPLNGFIRTSLIKSFELIQIFKAMATAVDVTWCAFDRCEHLRKYLPIGL